MKRIVVPVALMLACHAAAIGLPEALRAAPARPDAITTRLELLNARNDLLRVESDPLALRIDRVRASQAVELLEARQEHAGYAAQLEIAEAYTAALAARTQADLAAAALALRETALEVAGVRFRNGGATSLDVRDAEIAVEDSRQALAAARSGLEMALANLEGLVGIELDAQDLTPLGGSDVPPLPDLDDVLEGLLGHPTLLQAAHGLALARLGVELLDPSYAPQAQIEAARTQLLTAEELVAEAERGFALQARNAHLQAKVAADRLAVAQERMEAAESRLGVQRARLQGGLISRIELEGVELETAQQRLELQQARHDHLLALLRLQMATMYDLGLAGDGG